MPAVHESQGPRAVQVWWIQVLWVRGEPGTAHSRKNAGEEVGKGPRKFMLGVNCPVVPARIAKRILNCEFGDMAKLSNENLELEKRRSGEGDDAKASTRGKL